MVASAHPLATLAGVETLKAGGDRRRRGRRDQRRARGDPVQQLRGRRRSSSASTTRPPPAACTSSTAPDARARGRASTSCAAAGMNGLPVIGPATVSVPGCRARVGHAARALRLRARSTGCWPRRSTTPSAASHAPRSAEPGASRSTRRAIPIRSGVASSSPAGARRRRASCSCSRTSRARCATSPPRAPISSIAGRVAQAIAERHGGRRLPHAPTTWPRTAASGASRIATTYRGVTVYETPPPTQGLTALIGAQHARGVLRSRAIPLHSPEHLHLLLEITKLAYADRDRWIGDPAQAHVPVDGDARQDVRRRAAAQPSIRGRPGATRPAIPTATPPASSSPTGRATSSA